VSLFSRRKTVFVDADVLVVGGGMAGCGATYEAGYWGRDLKVVCVEKANIERSGAVAQGLYAINCYMGMQWDENQPEDHVRYARNDLMGLVREDLGYDIARHVDSTVHKFEEWGLPIMRDPETGRYQREGKWQIMIHGESYKPIVAEAARKAASQVYNRIMVTHLLTDRAKPGRVAGVYQSLELLQGISVITLIQLDRQAQCAPAFQAVFAGDDGPRVLEREGICGQLSALEMPDLRQMLTDAANCFVVSGEERP